MAPTFSVFTPSNDPKFLADCWDSLKAQTHPDFEWIVVLNGDAVRDRPSFTDPRVIVRGTDARGVGALKKEAIAHANGEFLVELDHDDLLSTNALEEIGVAFTNNPEVGLVYSDAAQVNEDLSYNDERFADGHGWTWRDTNIQVADNLILKVMACDAKPPTPHNVSYIWYAPNHVRAFRRSVYESIGGYDASLEVCDDADLICRMYQAAPFFHIPLCLYAQRLHANNTQRDKTKNAKIQAETVRIYDANIQPNALVWAKRENLGAVDLGGAHNSPPGYIPVDKELGDGDIFDWLAKLGESSIGVIRAVDFIEHITDPIRLMNELYRVLAPGGMLLTLTPSTDGRGAFCDPTHVSFWNELSFRYYTNPEFAKYVPQVTAAFRQSRLVTYFPNDWHQSQNLPYVCFNGTKEVSDGDPHQAREPGQVHGLGQEGG